MASGELMLYVALACGGLAVGLASYLILSARPTGEVLGEASQREIPIANAVMRLVLPIARTLAPLHKNALAGKAGQALDKKLRRAGRPFGMTVPEFLALRYVGAIIGFGLGYALCLQMSGEINWMILGPVGIFGFLYPGLRLNALVNWRMRKIFRDMPYALDLLTLSTEAGLDFASAMATVVDKGPQGPLIDEFRISHQEVMLGKPRGDSLRALADRVDLTEIRSFVLALLQAEQLGASVAATLRTMAEQMRVKRWTLAEEMAGKVPVKLMAPLVACIFPSSFIVLFVPIYLRYQVTGGF